MTDLGEKIRYLRRKERMTQEELAHALNVQRNTVWRWENEKANPDKDTIVLLASILNTSVAYLTNETDDPARAAPTRPEPEQLKSNARPVNMVRVPMIGGVIKACCGSGNAYASDVEWDVEGQTDIPTSELVAYQWQVGDGGFHTIRVEGNSMEPRIHDGDIILFGDLPISNGNFALVKYDDRLIVRGVWNEHNGHYTLRALNPAYKDIDVDLEDESRDFYILGKVIRRISMENLADGMI